MGENDLKELCKINEIDKYLDYLEMVKNKCIVFMVVKDTPGSKMPDYVIDKFIKKGFSNFSKQLWKMYAGIKYGDKILLDQTNEVEEAVSANIIINNDDGAKICEAELVSKAWRKGNDCSIKINNIEYAVKKRGINLVVYDPVKQIVVDSLSYDSHDIPGASISRWYELIKWIDSKKGYYDFCVLGFWYGKNYGSLLNGYVLYYLLRKVFNKKVLMVGLLGRDSFNELSINGHNINFINNYYDKEDIRIQIDYSELYELNKICDSFCIGSDQCWNYKISFYENTYLPFVDREKRIISFATSLGHKNDLIPINAKSRIKSYLEKYTAISVREHFSMEILKNNYGIRSTVVLEPVFCIDKNIYFEIAKNSNINFEKPYLLTYILDPTPQKRKAILYYSQKLGIEAVNILDGNTFDIKKAVSIMDLPNIYNNIEVADFLNLFMHADYVITDSFHGTAFSIIFEKSFLSIANPIRGFERFSDLLGRLKLTDRLVVDHDNIPNDEKYLEPIDYAETNNIIKSEAKRTVEWLKGAIETPKENLPSVRIPTQAEIDKLYTNADFIKIRILATLLRDYGIKHVVLSPGGRDVPIVRMFEYNSDDFVLHRVVDERSAGYYGLGIAAQLQEPVVCVCTSGTAASNYLPAVTEAYHTGIPLIMVTADRYQIYYNQGEDQTINQKHIYSNFVKREITLPEGYGYSVEYQTRRDISECILETMHNTMGPVHINIAIGDIGIGSKLDKTYWHILPKIYPHILRTGFNYGKNDLMRWVRELEKSNRILIVFGQNAPQNAEQIKNIERFTQKYNCVIITDFISNLSTRYSIRNNYNMLWRISQTEFNEQLSPDILISVGGKRLMNDPITFKIRGGKGDIRNWDIEPDGKIKDYYFRLTSVIEMSQDRFFEWFSDNAGVDSHNDEVYYKKWKELADKYQPPIINEFTSNYIYSKFIPSIPENSILHLGVGQSFIDTRQFIIKDGVNVFCNMGTNGIDGCTSTFLGQCVVEKEKLCFLLIGDLSFFYDMNSIWNKTFGYNIRILLVNNSGSGLLRGNNLKGITSEHHTSAKEWVEKCGFKYISATNPNEFNDILPMFIDTRIKAPLFWEVFCK